MHLYNKPYIRTGRLPAAVFCLLAVGLSACSAGDDGQGGDKPNTSAASDPGADATTVSGNTGDLQDPKGAIAALSDFTCEPDGTGVWSARGTLTNSAETETRFLVSVSVIKSKTYEVLGSTEKMYTLGPKAHRQLAWGDIYDERGMKLQCVPRVVSGK
jgi:hypothetical protein